MTQVCHVLILRRPLRQLVNTKMVSLYTYRKGTECWGARNTRPHTILKFNFSMLMFNEAHEKLLQSYNSTVAKEALQ